jgi:hypothetical protein
MPTWTGLGANNNWNTIGNWDTAVPTAATTALFTGVGVSGSKNCTITAGAACSLISCSGYTGQINFANSLTVAGNVTLGSGMTTSGSGNIIKTGTGTLISNGVGLSGGITLPAGAGTTQTFGSNWVITGSFGGNLGSVTIVGGGFTASIGGNLTAPAQQGISTTPLMYLLTGTGTLSGGYAAGSLTARPIIQISSSGTITQASTSFRGVDFTYTTGTYNSTANLIIGSTVTNTFNNVSGILFNSILFENAAGQSMTLNSNMYISGNLSTAGGVNGAINGAFPIYVSGSIVLSGIITGTSTIEMVGPSNASISAGTIQNNLTINKSGGASVTFPTGGTIVWGATGRTLTYTAGSLNVSTSTFSLNTNNNVTINGMSFYNLTIVGPNTVTMDVANSITNNLTLAATQNVTFTGSAGWTCANLICSTTSRTITLANISTGASYRTTSTASLTATSASRITMTSNNATTRSIWTLDYGAQQTLVYVNGIRIDSSLGQTIWTFDGVRTDTVNWATGSRPGTSAYTFVN